MLAGAIDSAFRFVHQATVLDWLKAAAIGVLLVLQLWLVISVVRNRHLPFRLRILFTLLALLLGPLGAWLHYLPLRQIVTDEGLQAMLLLFLVPWPWVIYEDYLELFCPGCYAENASGE